MRRSSSGGRSGCESREAALLVAGGAKALQLELEFETATAASMLPEAPLLQMKLPVVAAVDAAAGGEWRAGGGGGVNVVHHTSH